VSPITLALTSPTNWILVAVNLPNKWRREENRREIEERRKKKEENWRKENETQRNSHLC
jgi:hypothetical protein